MKNREARLRRLKERGRALANPTKAPEASDSKVRSINSRSLKPDAKPDLKLESRPKRGNRPTGIRPNPQKSAVRSVVWQFARFAIAGIGLSMIAGTMISLWHNHSLNSSVAKNTTPSPVATSTLNEDPTKPTPETTTALLKTQALGLESQIKQLASQESDLGLQVMVIDIDGGNYVNIGASQPIASASTIKTPILVAFLQDVDAGKIKLDEQLEMTSDVRVGESGSLQYQPLGTKLSALETAKIMIIYSDNTATNMIVKRLGGAETLNQRFKSWGLTTTVLRNPLPDLEGTNTISSQDLVNVLALVDQGKLIKPRSRDRFMDIMRLTETNTLLPKGLGEGARIAHKTGDIGSVVGDAGIIDMPNGKRYIMAALVKRPNNDQRANELIRKVSRVVYENFDGASRKPDTESASPAPTTNPPNNTATPFTTPSNSETRTRTQNTQP
ncbi:serine hydrolase [Tumidithrix helvetica PCC 7403]|uniref:serine hydrolase n=1 Tax=Tumidithrix helvetica TaxID=3457545 RepID=UPI003CC0195A